MSHTSESPVMIHCSQVIWRNFGCTHAVPEYTSCSWLGRRRKDLDMLEICGRSFKPVSLLSHHLGSILATDTIELSLVVYETWPLIPMPRLSGSTVPPSPF